MSGSFGRGLAETPGAAEVLEVEARPLKLGPGIDLDQALELAARLEDEETVRKLELRK